MSPLPKGPRLGLRDDSSTNSSGSKIDESSSRFTENDTQFEIPTFTSTSTTSVPSFSSASGVSTSTSSVASSVSSLSGSEDSSSTFSSSASSFSTSSSISSSITSSITSQLLISPTTSSDSSSPFSTAESSSSTTSSEISVNTSPISPTSISETSISTTSLSPTTAITSQSILVVGPSTPEVASEAATTSINSSGISSSSSASNVSASTSHQASGAMAASPSGFWTNKSAVAGTFTTVALVGLAIVIGALFYIRRKRKASHLRNLSYSEKSLISDPRPYSTPSEHSSQDFSHEPMNAFAPSDPAHYPTYDPFSTGSAHHALYSGNASLPEITYSYAQDVNNQYPYYGDEVNNAPLPSSVTRSALQTSSLRNPFEPVPARNPFEPVRASRNPFEPLISAAQETTPVSRNSATYPPSVDDSFYGDSMDGRAL